MKRILFSLSIVLLLCSTAAAKEVNEGMCKSYLEMYCSRCHSTERMCKYLEKNDSEKWRAVIKKMAEYAEMDQDIQDTTHACLSGMKAGDALVCKKKQP
jgi:hypothetical protein